MKDILITIRASVEDSDMEAVKKMEHHAEAITEAYPELQDISVKVSEYGYPYNLGSFEERMVSEAFVKKCNMEDILECSDISESERDNKEFLDKVAELYEDKRNDNPDWNYYLRSAVREAREILGL